jgi:putative DNA primase/helicase
VTLVEAITSAAARVYGVAGRAWLEWACEHFAGLPQRLDHLVEQHRNAMVPDGKQPANTC